MNNKPIFTTNNANLPPSIMASFLSTGTRPATEQAHMPKCLNSTKDIEKGTPDMWINTLLAYFYILDTKDERPYFTINTMNETVELNAWCCQNMGQPTKMVADRGSYRKCPNHGFFVGTNFMDACVSRYRKHGITWDSRNVDKKWLIEVASVNPEDLARLPEVIPPPKLHVLTNRVSLINPTFFMAYHPMCVKNQAIGKLSWGIDSAKPMVYNKLINCCGGFGNAVGGKPGCYFASSCNPDGNKAGTDSILTMGAQAYSIYYFDSVDTSAPMKPAENAAPIADF